MTPFLGVAGRKALAVPDESGGVEGPATALDFLEGGAESFSFGFALGNGLDFGRGHGRWMR